jgi:hypothetical protein
MISPSPRRVCAAGRRWFRRNRINRPRIGDSGRMQQLESVRPFVASRPGMHHSMHSGSMARAPSTLPMSATSLGGIACSQHEFVPESTYCALTTRPGEDALPPSDPFSMCGHEPVAHTHARGALASPSCAFAVLEMVTQVCNI